MHEFPQSLFIFNNSFPLRLTEKKSSRTKTFSKSIYYMFCLYHFSVKCIIKKNYLLPCGPLMFSIISSLAAGIKPLLVSDLRHKTVVGTYLLMTSPIASSNATNGSAEFKLVLHVRLLTALQTLSLLVRCFKKTVLLTLYYCTDC